MSSSSFDESRPLAGEYESATQHIKHRSWRQRALMPLLLINATLTLTATVCLYRITSTLAQTKTTTQADCFDDTLLNPPIVWETRTFNSSVDTKEGIVTDRFEPVSPTTSADWSAILDVGEIRLSEEEATRLSKGTARLYGDEEGYAGVLEVFHQLHCLNRIRKKFHNLSAPSDDKGDSDKLIHWHDEHCFNYLWQTLLCHADVSVMTVGWNEKQQAFNADFAVTKQCRNFDVIHNWAKNRQAKFTPPGDSHPGRIEGE